MATGYVLYNLKAGHQTALEDIMLLRNILDSELEFVDMENVKSYRVFFNGLERDDFVVICGGDGTLNQFVNKIEGLRIANEILYYPTGTGNDFAADLNQARGCAPFSISQYIKSLPYVIVNGNKYRFINGVGYGIDGYCCQVGDEIKKTAGKKVNYTAIAIKGLLFHYKPTAAAVTVDGRTYTYDKVWLAPTMNGRFYGGGMMPAPGQHRDNPDHTLSVMVIHSTGKLRMLLAFPSIFKGEHIRYSKIVDVFPGHKITVQFERPTPLQIDGETILDVQSYTAGYSQYLEEQQDHASCAARSTELSAG